MKIFSKLVLLVLVLTVSVACQNKKADTTPSAGLQSVYFDYDQAFIRSEAVSVMQGNASNLKAHDTKTVTIEGNCDNRGTNEYNLALGHRRSEAAKNYLINLGVGANRLKTMSYGEEKPVCFSSDENCWQKNRRDDFRD